MQRDLGAVTNLLDGPLRRAYQVNGWVAFNGVTTTAILDSENVSSLTDNGTGDTTITWASPMSTADYAVGAGCQANNAEIASLVAGTTAPTAAALRVLSNHGAGASADIPINCIVALDDTLNPNWHRKRPAMLPLTFIKYNSTPGTPTIDGSKNITSLTDNGAGDITITFTRSYSNANYAFVTAQWHSANDFSVGKTYFAKGGAAPTAGTLRMQSSYGNGLNSQDSDFLAVTIFGH